MAYRFNSGMGGVTCDSCNMLICTGGHPDYHYVYSTKREDFYVRRKKDGKLLHACSMACAMKQTPPKQSVVLWKRMDEWIADENDKQRRKNYKIIAEDGDDA